MVDTNSYSDSGLHSVIQFIKNVCFSFSRTYPSALLHDNSFYDTVPPHWGISLVHKEDVSVFINQYYNTLQVFKHDKIISRLLL